MAVSKSRVVRYDYVDTTGEVIGSRASDAAVGLNYVFLENTGEVNDKGAAVYKDIRTVPVLFSDFPANINSAMAAHGWKQKGGDTFAGAVKAGEEPAEMLLSALEHLKAGDWNVATQSGGSGPRPSMVRLAMIAVLVRDYGKDAEDSAFLETVTGLLDTADKRKAALANPAVKAEFELMKAKAAALRAEKAAEAAAKAGDDEGTDNSLFDAFE